MEIVMLKRLCASALFVAAMACGGGKGTPASPTTTTAASARPLSLKIGGPDAIAPGQSVSFGAVASMSDGTAQDYTRKVAWSAYPASVLSITPDTGVATGQSPGDVTVMASLPGGGGPFTQAQITRTVLVPNTYRLTGKALESGLPVQGAAIAVLSGVGAGLATTTDYDGAYRLYGVAGATQIRFSKPGYDDIVKDFTATQNDVLDFPEAHQTAAIPQLAGTYTLTLTADPGCPTTPSKYYAALPDDFRQPRSYPVSVTQDGPALSVTLTGPTIMAQENHFTGRIKPDTIEFQIGFGYFGYGLDDGVAEQVSSTQWFVFGGDVPGQRSGGVIHARLDGALEIYAPDPEHPSPSPYALTATCIASNNQVTLTPDVHASRHR
jgi:hypothetical protein